ncbi:MAG: hypothetical protein JXO22_08195 [Phycisphaerae bacterium]|nr:hypothetical protein [Phycisphaerae bacterium]
MKRPRMAILWAIGCGLLVLSGCHRAVVDGVTDGITDGLAGAIETAVTSIFNGLWPVE